MMILLDESREYFIRRNLFKKLIRRFWNVLEGYKNGKTYGEMLSIYFSGRSKEKIESHRKISNKTL